MTLTIATALLSAQGRIQGPLEVKNVPISNVKKKHYTSLNFEPF